MNQIKAVYRYFLYYSRIVLLNYNKDVKKSLTKDNKFNQIQ